MWFAIITIFIKIWFCYAVDYCKLCETHTMCNYKVDIVIEVKKKYDLKIRPRLHLGIRA